jgi:uncharacterized protein YjiS (DUF1127 family)
MTALAIQTSRTLWGSFTALVNQMVTEVKRQRVIRAKKSRIVTELSRYSDRELADLGFTRYDISSVANGTYAR